GHHPVDESGGRVNGAEASQEGHRLPELLQLPSAICARGQVSVERGALRDGERVVQQGGELLARVVARHGKNRSSFSLKSSRARWSRERTVPTGSSSTSAISS